MESSGGGRMPRLTAAMPLLLPHTAPPVPAAFREGGELVALAAAGVDDGERRPGNGAAGAILYP